MFGIQEHLIREVSGLKERGLGEEMDPVRSWVRNVGVVDANVAAQRYGPKTANPLMVLLSGLHQLLYPHPHPALSSSAPRARHRLLQGEIYN